VAQPLSFRKIGFTAAQSFCAPRGGSFGPLALGDVSRERKDQPPASFPELPHADLDGEHSSVLSAMTPLERKDFPDVETLEDRLQKRRVRIRVEVGHSHADQFVPAIA